MTDPTQQTTPTRDEAVRDESKVTTAMIDAAFKVCPAGAISEIGTGGMQRMLAAALASAPAPASGRVDADEVKRIRDWLLERNRDHLAAMHERTHIMSRKDGDAEMFLDAAILLCHLASLSPAATPVSEADMRAFGASEMAAYKWPDDTPEHRAARAAFCEGAALAKPSSPAGGEPTGNSGLLLGEASADDAPCYLSSEHADSWAKGFNAAVRALSQSTSAGRVGE